MNARQKRNEPSHDDNGAGRYPYSPNLTKGVPDLGSSRHLSAALSSRLGFRLKTLGGLLYVTINGRGGIVQPRVADGNEAASAEPDLRSQPTVIEPAFVAVAKPTDLDREILEREARRLQGRDVAPAAEESAAIQIDEAPRATPRSGAPSPRARPGSQRRRAAQPADRSEEDFLAREGYIY